MTVPATSRRAGPYNGNGSTTSFSFSFKTFAAGDLQVTKTGTTGLESVLVLNSDYSVTLNGDQDASPGGSITYPISGTALASGEKLTIVGDLDYEQTTDLLGGGAFNARTIEDTFDRTVIQIQQLEERADRALTLPVSATASTVLPVPAAGKVIAWDSSASALVNVDANDLASTVAYANWRTDRFSGNGSTTAFTLAADPGSVHNMDVSIGGVVQQNGVDFTVSGTTLTFTSAPPSGTHNVLARYGQALPVGTANASNVTFDPAGTGASSRTVQSKLRDVVSVLDFGADPTGVSDSTTAIQNANNSLPATGGALYFPAGYYRVGALTLNKSALYYGDGYATVIQANSATADIFTVSAQGATVSRMRFLSAVTRTAGKFVKLASSDTRLEYFWMSGAFEGVEIADGTAVVTIAGGSIRDTVASTGVSIRVSGGFDVSIRDIIMDNNAAAQPFAGIYVTSVGDLTIEDCNIIHCGSCLTMEAATGKVLASVWANNCFFDTAVRGAFLNCTGGSIVRCIFDQCWFSSHTNQGVLLSGSGGAIDGIEFTDCHFFLNSLDGLNINTSLAKNISINGGAFAQNGGAGVSVAANVGEFSIQGIRAGSCHGLTGNGYGIFINSGSGNNYRIFNNDLRGNTTSALTNAATGTSVFVMGNLGHNPRGQQGIVVGASPFTYTAGNTPETVYINGGTVSLVTLDGANVFQQTNCTVRLGPKKTVTVTYSVAPGMATTID